VSGISRGTILFCSLILCAHLAASRVAPQSAPHRKDIPSIAKAANGAIVSIVMSDKDGHAITQGTGFLISKDGRIVTNYHVIENGISAIVKLPDGAFFVVDGVLASDKARDLAVIKAHGENFRTLIFGNSDRVQVGEDVVAIGNPLSLESTVSNGIVSGIRTSEELGGKFLQVTTPISPGSSGGPLFNMAGEVIGITTLYLKGGENLNFAIPINDAKHLLLAKFSKVQRFPNEPESVEESRSDSATKAGLSDRDYYQQLYAAGAIFPEHFATAPDGSKFSIGRIPTGDHACFSDNAYSGTFFIFVAYGYDENYRKALEYLSDDSHLPMRGGDAAEWTKQENTLQAIQQAIQTEAPYVHFSMSERDHVPSGFRILYKTVYNRGVKVNELDYPTSYTLYKWHGSSWSTQIPSKAMHLTIEPATMRYGESMTVQTTTRGGETAATDTHLLGPRVGGCEKIPDPK
jgi:hypothetical protein